MTTEEHESRAVTKLSLCVVATFLSIAAVTILCAHHAAQMNRGPVARAFIEKLESARHFESQFPAQRQTIDLAKRSSLRHAALNAIGMELREVRGMATGSPDTVFAMLSHLGGFGEIIWVDEWTNFPVKLPPTSTPGQIVVPRRDAVRAALDAVEASGGCLIKAGEQRYLVARISEKQKYEAAIRALSWLGGTPPPWVKSTGSHDPNAEQNGPANGSQPIRSGTNRASSAAGSRPRPLRWAA